MNKNKENTLQDFYNMILNSWTYNKLTKEEIDKFDELMEHTRTQDALKGTYNQRWEILQAIYGAFLYGCGYNGPEWREKDERIY